ncbi:uncharacterized protein E5676_scaffold134G001720 [Cucumis melo var. makuwa]|uniref:Uncharacterized protein LOC103493702 n=2 Tax=Cucumis melo TaxID=3656 RepID=A0A1S3BUL9_CUCME|nr:uncharacterized protein LOC103493702 [Cucumis melo]KAA0064538.1 uncharacterized protein E6C27_scaffold255G002580 [Cucumis melo var. makuwa]TYK20052.1 uncharacterized protein E5676_scaffold134G001720 [Cucumis melo var. makuwa]
MEVGVGAMSRRSRFSSYDRWLAVGLGLLAVVSPLYIDRRPSIEELEEEESSIHLGFWLPALLIILIFIIAGVLHLEQRCARFDPYWIHRVGGSSCGIFIILLLLAFVLKCKASLMFWES